MQGNIFFHDQDAYLPLYEAKMMHQFEHRHATYQNQSDENIRKGNCRSLIEEEHTNPAMVVLPRYWVNKQVIFHRLGKYRRVRKWMIGFRDVTRKVDRRTAQFSILPSVGVGHKIPLLFIEKGTAIEICGLVGNFNAFVLDFVARQKIGGISLSYFIVRQLPMFEPDRYTTKLLSYIAPRILELTYTAWDLKAFANDLWDEADDSIRYILEAQWNINAGATGGRDQCNQAPDWLSVIINEPSEPFPHPPFVWDQERRLNLRCELDALYGHLYGLNYDDLSYIIDTFPIVRHGDEIKYGEYRTKRLILENFEQLANEDWILEARPA